MRIRLEMMEEEVSKVRSVPSSLFHLRGPYEADFCFPSIRSQIAAVSESNKVELEKLKIDLAEEREQKERLERENRDLKASNGGPVSRFLPFRRVFTARLN